jgi:hypothetical protein
MRKTRVTPTARLIVYVIGLLALGVVVFGMVWVWIYGG